MSPAITSDLSQIPIAINGLAATMQKSPWDYANTIAVVLTLGVLIWYTVETLKLRRAAQMQTKKTEELLVEAQNQNRVSANLLKEAQWQNEISVMPMLAVIQEVTQAPSMDSRERHFLVLKNIGPGTAFNLSADSIISPSGELRVEYESNVKMPGQTSPFLINHSGEQTPAVTNIGVSHLFQEIKSGRLPCPTEITLRCSSITSVQYSFTFRFTPDAGTIKVTFEGFKTTFPGK